MSQFFINNFRCYVLAYLYCRFDCSKLNDEEQSHKIYEDRITEGEDVETVEDPEPQSDDNKETKAGVTPKRKINVPIKANC